MANRILMKGDPRIDEVVSTAVVLYPGYLLELTTAGKVQAHSTEGGYAERLVALEDALQGKDADTVYAVSTLVTFAVCKPGDEVRMYVMAGTNVSIGEKLISDGHGVLLPNGDEESATTVNQIIAVALEAQDLSDSNTVDTLTRVRLL